VVFVLPVVEFLAEVATRGFGGYYEIARVVLSVVCIGLLVHSWFMQRRYAQSKWRLGFFTLLLSLPMLGCVWLGLNVIRSYSYDFAVDYNRNLGNWRQNLYGYAVESQDMIVLFAKVLGIALALWLMVDLVRWMGKRVAGRPLRG